MRRILSIWLKSVGVMAVVVSLPLSSLLADQFRSRQTGNWNDITSPATWEISTNGGTTWSESTTRYPGQGVSGDTVLVRNGHTVTLNVSPANAIGRLTVGEGTSGALSIGGQTITVSGAVTVNNGATVTVTSVIGTKSFGSVVLNSGATWTSNAGETYGISGSLTMNGASIGGTGTGIFNVGTDFLVSGTNSIAAATLSVTGSTVFDGLLTFSSTTGTKTFNNVTINSGGQWNSTAAETYTIGGSLTMNGGTIDGTATGIFNVSGNFNIASGTNTLGNATITVTGTTDITGTLNITSSTGTKTFIGKITINSGGIWENGTGNSAIVLRGGLENNGTFTSGTGTYTFNTNNQTISGTNGLSFAGTGTSIAITGAITITNQTTVTVAGSITGSVAGSTWLNDANSTLNVAGALLTTGTLTATATPNLVNYNGTGAQTIKAANYNNLTISGARTTNNVTLPNGGTVGISGTFTPSATFTTGNYVTTGNTVDFNGSGTQTIPPLGTANYNNLTKSGSGTAQLSGNLGIAGNLTVSGGTLDLMTYTANRATAGGTLTVGAGATLRIGGTNGYPTNYTTNTLNVASTVEYYGSTQTISSTPTYGNLVLSGSGPKTTPTGTTTTTVAGNFTLGTGITYERASGATSTLTLNGTTNVNNGTLGSLANPFNTINIGNAGGDNLTNNGIMVVATSLAGSGSLTQGTNATLYIGGTFTTATVDLTANPNLVEYNGTGAQTIRAATYNNLTVSNTSAAVTIASNLTIDNDLSVVGTGANLSIGNNNVARTMTVSGSISVSSGATFAVNTGSNTTHTLNLSGDLTNDGTLNFASDGNSFCSIDFAGTTDQTISGSGIYTFRNMTISNTGGTVFCNSSFSTGGTFTVNANAIFSPGAAAVISGSGTLTGSGTIKVTRTAATADFLSQYTIANRTLTNLIVDYDAALGQTVNALNYFTLIINGNRGGSTVTFASGTVGISNSFVVNATNAVYDMTGNTINYNGAGAQTIIAFDYYNLTSTNTGARTLASSGTIGVAGVFTPGTNSYTVSGSTVEYNGTAVQSIAAFTYHNLTVSNSGTKNLDVTVTVNNLMTVNSGATLSVGGTGNLQVLGNLNNNGVVNNGGTINVGT